MITFKRQSSIVVCSSVSICVRGPGDEQNQLLYGMLMDDNLEVECPSMLDNKITFSLLLNQ